MHYKLLNRDEDRRPVDDRKSVVHMLSFSVSRMIDYTAVKKLKKKHFYTAARS